MDAVNDFADTTGEFARGQLPLAPQHQQSATHAGDDEGLHPDQCSGDQTQWDALHEDKHKRHDCLSAQQGGGDKGITCKAAERFDLVLHHAGDFRALQTFEGGGRKSQNMINQREADAAQQAFA